MQQKEFTEYIIPRIIERFPFFRDVCTNKPDDIVDIDYKSPREKLTFWLTTQDKEVTIGFTGDTECDWHTHMSVFGANTKEEELEEAIKLIDLILTDKVRIVHSTVLGYFITEDEDIERIHENKQEGEVIETLYWSEL